MRRFITSSFAAFQAWKAAAAVCRDADELIEFWGPAAYDLATELSRREDCGLLSSRRPGHWWTVRQEIGRRLGRQDCDPVAGFAA